MKTQVDMLGQVIKVGDLVALSDGKRSLEIGTVQKITPKGVSANCDGYIIYKPSSCILLVNAVREVSPELFL